MATSNKDLSNKQADTHSKSLKNNIKTDNAHNSVKKITNKTTKTVDLRNNAKDQEKLRKIILIMKQLKVNKRLNTSIKNLLNPTTTLINKGRKTIILKMRKNHTQNSKKNHSKIRIK